DRRSVCRLYLRKRVIFSQRVVMAVEKHAIERVLVVGVEIEFAYPIVAGIYSRESAQEISRRTRIWEQTACAHWGSASGASGQLHADRAWGYSRILQSSDRIH